MAEDRDGLEWAWLVAGPVAFLGRVCCAVVVVASFAPLELSDGAVAAVCAGALPLMFMSVATLMTLRRRHRDVLRTIERSAPSAWPLAALLFVAFWIAAATTVAASEGDPRIRDGRYFVVEHGVSTEITHDEYERQVVLHQRAIAGISGGLYAPAVCLGIYYYRLRYRGGTRFRS